MPNSWDMRPVGITNDPTQRLDLNFGKLPTLDPALIVQQWLDALQKYVFPAIKDITGLDFSSPEDFFFSLVTMITNGGSAVAAFVDALIAPILSAIKQFTGIDLGNVFDGIDLSTPGAVLKGIQDAIGKLVGGIIQKIIDAIVGGLNGSGSTGNDPLSIALSFLNPFTQINNVLNTIQTVSGTLHALFAGLQGQLDVNTANIATVAGAAAVTTTSVSDNLNRGSMGPNWQNVSGSLQTQVWFNDGFIRTAGFAAGYYKTSHPATDKLGVQCRLTAKSAGASRIWIGDAAMSNFVAAQFRCGQFGEDYIAIVTGSSPNVVVSRTMQPYSGYGLQNNAVIDLRYDPTINSYLVLKDGVVVPGLTWEDTTNTVTHGASNRVCGVASNIDNNLFLYGPAITDYKHYDWT